MKGVPKRNDKLFCGEDSKKASSNQEGTQGLASSTITMCSNNNRVPLLWTFHLLSPCSWRNVFVLPVKRLNTQPNIVRNYLVVFHDRIKAGFSRIPDSCCTMTQKEMDVVNSSLKAPCLFGDVNAKIQFILVLFIILYLFSLNVKSIIPSSILLLYLQFYSQGDKIV